MMKTAVKAIYVAALHPHPYYYDNLRPMPTYIVETVAEYAQYLDEVHRDLPEIDFLRTLVFIMTLEATNERKS